MKNFVALVWIPYSPFSNQTPVSKKTDDELLRIRSHCSSGRRRRRQVSVQVSVGHCFSVSRRCRQSETCVGSRRRGRRSRPEIVFARCLLSLCRHQDDPLRVSLSLFHSLDERMKPTIVSPFFAGSNFQATEAKMLRVAISTFYDYLTVSLKCLQEFSDA